MSQLARTTGQAVEAKTPARTKKRVKELPSYPGSTRPVQGSEWMVYVRDHDIDVTMNEWALATLYGTYGNWGQKAYPSDRWIARKLHVKPETVSRAREGLLTKGLIRCIGLAPNGQTNQFMYCLTLPVEVEDASVGRIQVEGVTPETDHGVSPNGSRVTPETDHGVSPNGAQHLDQIEGKLETSSQPDGDDGGIGPSAPGGQTPQAPQELGRLAARAATGWTSGSDPVLASMTSGTDTGHTSSGDEDGPRLIDWDDPDDGGCIAEDLGVPLASIGKPFRDWINGLIRSGDLNVTGEQGQDTDFLAFLYAAQDSAGKRNPVGYLKAILPGYVEELRSIGKQAFHAKHRAA